MNLYVLPCRAAKKYIKIQMVENNTYKFTTPNNNYNN
jgi:hypothetical protein